MIPFQDSTLADALVHGCDTVQVKYDGQFAQYCTSHGTASLVMGTARHPTTNGANCTLIGSYIPTGNRLHVFDCWCVEEPPNVVNDLRKEPYRARYVAAKIQLKLINPQSSPTLRLVQNHPITHAHALWRTLPDIPDAKGLVFRKSMDPVGVMVRVARWYREKPEGLV